MKNKKNKKLSGFKKFLLIYMGIFLAAAVVLLFLLRGILKDYEASEPNNVMEQMVKDFNGDTIEELLKETDTGLTEFESVDVLKEYFDEKIEGKTISYKRKSGEFTSAKPVYSLVAGDEVIATVALAEKEKNSHGFTEWKVGEITLADVKTNSDNSVKINAPSEAEVFINGIQVSDKYIDGEKTVVANTKNLQDFGAVMYSSNYSVSGLMKEPEVTAKLGDTELKTEKTDDGYIVSYPTDEALLAAQKEYIEKIYKSYGTYIINRGSLDTLLSYTKGKANTYLSDIPAVWAYLWGQTYTYEFRNESVTNLVKYSDNCFAADVYFDLYVDYHTGNTTYNTSMTFIMINENGTWYLADFIQHQVESEE